MAGAEIVNDFENVSDRELHQKYSSEALKAFSNKYPDSDKEIGKLVEMSKSSEPLPTESCNEDSTIENIDKNSLVDETLPSVEPKDGQSNQDEWLDIMGSGNFKKKV